MKAAVYDAFTKPLTFDILCFIASVGAMTAEPVHFVILADKWRDKTTKDRALTPGQKMRRVHHILAASCWLLPATHAVSVVTNRVAADRWRETDAMRPDTFLRTNVEHSKAGRDVRLLRAPKWALEDIGDRFDNAVVFTIRQSPVVAEKNCKSSAWLALAGYAHSKGHRVVLIPDTATVVAGQKLSRSFEWFPPAATDVALRAAVYQRAKASFACGAGPAAIPLFMPGKRVGLFLRHRHLASSSQMRSFEKVWGIGWGDQLPWDGPFLDYRVDDESALIETFDKVMT